MPWTLRFPFDTVDARVAARQAISELRRDPAVTDVQFLPNLPRSAWFDTVQVQVEFLEGHEEPSDRELAERMRVYLPDEPVPERPLRGLYDRARELFDLRSPQRTPEETRRLTDTLLQQERPNENGDLIVHDVRQQIIQQYLGSAEGRTRLATSMAAPLRQRIDYQSIGRRTFLVEQLPDGALPVYTEDPGRVGSRFEPPIFVLPAWVQPGAFARFVGPGEGGRSEPGRIVEIESVLLADDGQPNYIRVWTWSRVGTWAKDTDLSANDVIAAPFFARLWEPCERPTDPLPVWDRLLGDEPDEDAPCGPQEPAREPGGARTAWSRLGWDEPWQGPLRTQPLPEGALPVYD